MQNCLLGMVNQQLIPDSKQQRIIGLTGGIATGKTTVANYLAQHYDLPVLDADVYAKEVVSRGSPILKEIFARYGDRIMLAHRSAGDMPDDWQNRFDLVFSNPPFFELGAIQAPGRGKEAAYLESITLKAWINAMLFALRPKGTFVMVHRAADMARILSVIERQTGEITVLPIHSYPGADAKRVLVRARKGLRSGPLRLLEPRYLYDEKGGERRGWTLAMQRDGAEIDWN